MNVYGGMTSLKHSINRRDPLHGDFQLEDKAKFRSIFETFHVKMFHWRIQQPPAFRQNYTSLWCLCNLFIIDAINERLYDTFHGSLCMMGLWLKPATLDMPVKKKHLACICIDWKQRKLPLCYRLPFYLTMKHVRLQQCKFKT